MNAESRSGGGSKSNSGTFVSVTNTGTDPSVADSDGDGLSDGNEIYRHLTNPLSLDSDNDGINDAYEIQTGFDPNAAQDRPTAQLRIHPAVEMEFITELGTTYRLQVSTDGETWEDTDEVIEGTGEAVSEIFRQTRSGTKKLWRIRRE